MKFTLLALALLVSQLSFAQTIKEQKVKQEMLERTDVLIEKVVSAREDLSKDDVVSACKKIKEIFELYPAHLTSIGSHLDFEKNKTVKAKDVALSQLVFMHKTSQLCDRGTDSEYVDPGLLGKELKFTLKSLEKQKKTIQKGDTGSENKFYYEYEF